jgi:hypothetical protein
VVEKHKIGRPEARSEVEGEDVIEIAEQRSKIETTRFIIYSNFDPITNF